MRTGIGASQAILGMVLLLCGTAVGQALWPVDLTPSVTGNFGTLEVPELHGALDIDAPEDTVVRAPVNLTLVAACDPNVDPKVRGNFVIFSDGTNLYSFAHITKTLAGVYTDYDPRPVAQGGDLGRAYTAGETIGYVLGAAHDGGGSFDHIHARYAPEYGDDGHILDANGNYLSTSTMLAMVKSKCQNPLRVFGVNDPAASDGDNRPEIGPIFWQPVADTVGGFTEFGNTPTNNTPRTGAFVNGSLRIIEQITDDQGGIQPAGGSVQIDPIDNTVLINDMIVSSPYSVSYEVMGKGVVQGHNIPERWLVKFDGQASDLVPHMDTIYDRRRDVNVPGPHPTYNNCYVLTSTDRFGPDPNHNWNTRAKAGTGQADGYQSDMATRNAEGMFPDGYYIVHGNGYDLGAHGELINQTRMEYEVLVNNWKQTVLIGSIHPANPVRAADTFDKDVAQRTVGQVQAEYGQNSDVYAQGDNYLADEMYMALVMPHSKQGWSNHAGLGSPPAWKPIFADATGHVPWTKIVNTKDLGSVGRYDIIFDYDMDQAFSWTLDGIGAFDVKPGGTVMRELITTSASVHWSSGDSWLGGSKPGLNGTVFAISGSGNCEVVVDESTEVSAVYVSGSGGDMTVQVEGTAALTVSQVVNVVQGGSIHLDGGTLHSPEIGLNGGSLSGAGMVTVGQTLKNAGQVSPGNSPGTLTIDGDYCQDPAGTLLMELAGGQWLQYDHLIITGLATLGGTLEVQFLDGFVPALGSSFDLLNWQLLAGQFDVVELPALHPYYLWDTTDLYVGGSLMVIPEPAALALLSLGALAALRRKT